MRYDNAKILRDRDGNRYFRPTIVPNIPLQDSDIFMFPREGERFDTLAQKYYGDSTLWWIIAKANELNNGKLALDPDQKIRIPMNIDTILDSVRLSNA